jgi:hypothetical protein
MAGDIQLARPRIPGTDRSGKRPLPTRRSAEESAGRSAASERQRRRIYHPNEPVPVSGVYDIVDEDGNYLGSQITCHQDRDFPPTQSRRAHKAHEQPYGYRLAYEALHLQPPRPRDTTIHLPGETVRISGVYDVVSLSGEYLRHQRACVEARDGEAGEEHKFPETEGPEPGSYGYLLAYEAEHLTHH